jgi:pectate lyase
MMKRWFIAVGILGITGLGGCRKQDSPAPDVPVKVAENAFAFPGADGFGKNVTGGRGGKVIYVTTLEDSGVGSLRSAIQTFGPRYILFKVSGNIELKSPLTISAGDVTIAGQTAPGDGICIKNHPVQVYSDNVVIRFMRFRMGDTGAEEADALGGRYFKNWMIDHCSMSWSTDECASFYGNENFTMQWCIISESLRNSIHMKGIHGYGGIWGGKNATFHHNLLAHHDSRNPRFDHPDVYSSPAVAAQMRGTVDFRNNVIYNWGNDATYGGELGTFNVVANYYKPGPASLNRRRFLNAYQQATVGKPIYGFGKFFVDGNFLDGAADITANNWLGVEAKNGTAADKDAMKLPGPLTFVALTSAHTAEQSYAVVLNFAGASLRRDAVDTRIVSETRNGTFSGIGSKGSTNGLIDSQADVGGWPVLTAAAAPPDTDGDGMPDEWEVTMKLDPKTAKPNGKDLSTAYDNVEVYLHSLVREIMENEIK